MKIKYMKILLLASIVNVCLGVLLIILGCFEILKIFYTDASTQIQAGGVSLSILVFISGILIFLSGGFTVLKRDDMNTINLQIIIGALSLAWPVCVSIALFFSQYIICLRLVPTVLASFFYMFASLVVKIGNDKLKKIHKINPSMQVESVRKKKNNIDIINIMNKNTGKSKSIYRVRLSNPVLNIFKTKHKTGVLSRLYSGSRRRGKIRLRSKFK